MTKYGKNIYCIFYCVAEWVLFQINVNAENVINRDVLNKLTVCKKERKICIIEYFYAFVLFLYIPFHYLWKKTSVCYRIKLVPLNSYITKLTNQLNFFCYSVHILEQYNYQATMCQTTTVVRHKFLLSGIELETFRSSTHMGVFTLIAQSVDSRNW